MGKARWIYSAPKRWGCISCHVPMTGPGDRCPACRDKLRLRRRRKPR